MGEKILTCAPLPPPHGGITNWYQILMGQAAQQGVTLINVDTSPKMEGNKRSLFHRVVVQGFGMLRQRKALKKAIKENDNILCAHIATSASLGLVRDIVLLRLLKKKAIPTVYHLHFGRASELLAYRDWECVLFQKAVDLAQQVIAIDRRSEWALNACYPYKTIRYVPNPVEQIDQGPQESENTVLYLGMVYKQKGIEELLTAWQQVRKEFPDWKLVIAGACDADYKTYLEANFDMQQVSMPGFLAHDEAMKLLRRSAFLTLPSYTEGFPNVVVEAMMCQKAVVATSVGAIEDMLWGGCGVVIPPEDAQALATGLRQLMADAALRRQMGQKGKQKAQSQYAAHRVFAQYRAIWQSCRK